jgi:hypothetical protein
VINPLGEELRHGAAFKVKTILYDELVDAALRLWREFLLRDNLGQVIILGDSDFTVLKRWLILEMCKWTKLTEHASHLEASECFYVGHFIDQRKYRVVCKIMEGSAEELNIRIIGGT